MLTYYEILQVEEGATQSEIKRAYRRMCMILHPDKHDNTKEANVIFNLLHEAYETLSDPNKRKNYNPKTHKVNASSTQYSDIINDYEGIVRNYKEIVRKKERPKGS